MNPNEIRYYPAPAKLNLDLRITGRREDGYHNLESIFILIDLCDQVGIRLRDDDQIILKTPIEGVHHEDNLVVRAAQALKPYALAMKGIDVYLEKHIPMGGGLGGGSSNAATVLLVLNQLWQCKLNTQQLIDIGVKLGADVPFFLFGQSAFARGIGEQLQAIEVPQQAYIVVQPNAAVATVEIFKHPSLKRNSPACEKADYIALQPLRNDMEDVVFQLYPQVKKAHQILQIYGEARMTGSGACVFLPQENLNQARATAAKLPEIGQVYCVLGLNQHPIFAMLK